MKKLKKVKKYKSKQINVNIAYKGKTRVVQPRINYNKVRNSNVRSLNRYYKNTFANKSENLRKLTRLANKPVISFKTPKWYKSENAPDNKRAELRNKYGFALGVTPSTLNRLKTNIELHYRFKNTNPRIIEQYIKNFDRYIDLGKKYAENKAMLKDNIAPSKAKYLEKQQQTILSELQRFEKNPSMYGFTNARIDEQTGERFLELPNSIGYLEQEQKEKFAQKLARIADLKNAYEAESEQDYVDQAGYDEEFTRDLIDNVMGGWDQMMGSNSYTIEYLAKETGMTPNELADWYAGLIPWKSNSTLEKNIEMLKKFRKIGGK